MNSEGKKSGPRGSACCTPESDQIMFPLAIRGVGEPCANDASLKISGQFIKHLRRIISRRMELNALWMSSFARMLFGDNSGGVNCGFACIFYRNPESIGPQQI